MIRYTVHILLASVVLSVLSGCAGMADATSKMAGLGVVTEYKSTFDGETIIDVSPSWLYDPNGSWGNSVKLGARWSSNTPEYVALILSYSSSASQGGSAYLGLSGVDISLDGEILSFSSRETTDLDNSGYNSVTRTIYTDSKNFVLIPYSVLEQMLAVKDCRLRIHTSKGYEDSVFTAEVFQEAKERLYYLSGSLWLK